RPLGVACNIFCRYCYQGAQRDAHHVRPDYDLERMKAAVKREGGPFTLFGGEPLLLSLADLEELFRWGMEQYGGTSIQTNATLITDEHIRLFQQYRVHVGVSVDGPDELNDLRWHGSIERTRQRTLRTLGNIAMLCQAHQPPGLIVTLHKVNASPERLPRLHDWVHEMDTLGIMMMRLHLLEVENENMRSEYSLSEEENIQILLGFAELQRELKQLRFDVLDEMEKGLLGRDRKSSCVWHACDPYTTQAVRGIEGNGQSSNCGRTNKDGVNFIKAERNSFERYIALYHTPQEEGGCKDCRFFMMCKGQCPGTAINGDWRNRSELCGVWKGLFTHLEERLLFCGLMPLSRHPARGFLENALIDNWLMGKNKTVQDLQTYDVQLNLSRSESSDYLSNEHVDEKHHFVMPKFVRHAFVGKEQKEIWEPRMAAIRSALGCVGVLAVAKERVPVSVVRVAPSDVLRIHNLAASHNLHAHLLSPETHARVERLVIGREKNIIAYLHALDIAVSGTAKGFDAFDTIADLRGIPECCQSSCKELPDYGLFEPVWRRDLNKYPSDLFYLTCSPMLNPLLHHIGYDLLGYQPRAISCEKSKSRVEKYLDLGRESGFSQEIDWLEEMLDWPMEWSSLHGIAEVKTGVFRIAYATKYTSDRVTIHYHGRTLSPYAARGVSFAYRDPEKIQYETDPLIIS
ncbi:radical SAM protein, partial [Candidatus Roizmanbacteria bacterium]|nr:radical SAM protein [Candidatus Roizmanbacteria bacterium]